MLSKEKNKEIFNAITTMLNDNTINSIRWKMFISDNAVYIEIIGDNRTFDPPRSLIALYPNADMTVYDYLRLISINFCKSKKKQAWYTSDKVVKIILNGTTIKYTALECIVNGPIACADRFILSYNPKKQKVVFLQLNAQNRMGDKKTKMWFSV
jgi:hypothetical protein